LPYFLTAINNKHSPLRESNYESALFTSKQKHW